MRRIVEYLLCCLGILLLLSCEPSAVSKGRGLYKAYFSKKLKDPESFTIHSEKYNVNGPKVEWTLDYSAKNSFGGMNREEKSFTTIGDVIWIDGNDYKLQDLK